MTAQELRDKIKRFEGAIAQTTDPEEKKVMQGVVDKLKAQLEDMEKGEKPAEKAPPAAEKEPKAPKVPKPKKEKRPKKVKVKIKVKKPEKPAKPEKQEKKPIVKTKIKVKAKKEKAEKKVEKTVKVSKVIPDEEQKTVRDVLEKEHFKVIFKTVGGKRVKVTVQHSDRTIAKNKIESAFTTISKKVNSDEEKKKYAADLRVLEAMQKAISALIENIYKAFNSHDNKALNAIARKVKSL
jgi:hypothetical protein